MRQLKETKDMEKGTEARTTGKCIIIAAGEITVSQIEVNEEDFVIAADGGLIYCDYLKLVPNVIIGDFDSLSGKRLSDVEVMENLKSENIIRLPIEKDDTDTIACVKYGLEKGYRDFRIYSACGGKRLDHVIANMQTLLFIKNRGAEGYLIDRDRTVFVIRNETVDFQDSLKGRMSLFSMGDQAHVSIRGMKYNAENRLFTNDFPLGVSNEFIGEKASVTVTDGAILCMVGMSG